MKYFLRNLKKEAVRGEEDYVSGMADMIIDKDDFWELKKEAKYIGVTKRFQNVMKTFPMPCGETPAGFQRDYYLDGEGILRLDLRRNISCDKNGRLRPTKVLFSADSANPYEVAPISPFLANLTCNPGIVYDLFLNNPKANVGNQFKTREEVMKELAKILGPGCDISVELNNPFEEDFQKILEEAEVFKEIFTEYRVVIKVPHTGVVTGANVPELLKGNKRLKSRYDQVDTADALRGHNLALKLREHGYRVNFTLMFEPFQTQLALQAKPYFINTFLRHRLTQSQMMRGYTDNYQKTGDKTFLEQLREYMIKNDYLSEADAGMDLDKVYKLARDVIEYRHLNDREGEDGLDGMRHNLRVLRNCNLEDTRLIVCRRRPEWYEDTWRVRWTAWPGGLESLLYCQSLSSLVRRASRNRRNTIFHYKDVSGRTGGYR